MMKNQIQHEEENEVATAKLLNVGLLPLNPDSQKRKAEIVNPRFRHVKTRGFGQLQPLTWGFQRDPTIFQGCDSLGNDINGMAKFGMANLGIQRLGLGGIRINAESH